MSRRPAATIGWELPTRLVSALVFLLAWQIAASLADSRLLPTVTSVLRAMLQQTISGALPWNLAITLGRVAAAPLEDLARASSPVDADREMPRKHDVQGVGDLVAREHDLTG